MSVIGNNIRALRILKGKDSELTQQDIADIAGVTRETVNKWESGTIANIRDANIQRLRDYFNLSIDDLRSDVVGLAAQLNGTALTIGKLPADAKKPIGTSAMVPMRILGKTHAGTPTEEIEDIKLVEVPETVARNHPSAFMLQVEGDCMNRSYPDGCLVMVDPTVSPWNGCAVVAEPSVGESVLRRYMRGQSSMMLAADSFSAYDDMVFAGEDEVKLVGVVVWFQAAQEECERYICKTTTCGRLK